MKIRFIKLIFCWAALVLLFPGCLFTAKKTEFLGLKLGEKMTFMGKPTSPPMLANDFKNVYYEIEYPNLAFTTVGVALTKNSEELKKEGITFKDEEVMYGVVFFNRESREKCTKEQFEKLITKISKEYDLKVIRENKENSAVSSGFEKFVTYYSKNVVWDIICAGETFSIKIVDMGVLLNNSNSEQKINPFQKSIDDIELAIKRTL